MPIGWIDFSKSERNKVLSVLDLLSEQGTLDELGIAPVRDGYSDVFFPGTSTIQTRAKYFLIVPYALKDLEYSNESNPNRLLRIFDETEKKCGEILVSNKEDTDGIIGSRSLADNKWVKRTPAIIYWAGLRNYGIFNGGNLSLTEYIRAMCVLKSQKHSLLKLGNRNDNTEVDGDDHDAGELFKRQFWKIPTYQQNWIDNLSIKLTKEEGGFLKNQIVSSFPDTMLAYILRHDLVSVFSCNSFQDLKSIIHVFPDHIQDDYYKAYDFSEFLYVLRTVYNMIVSNNKNEKANTRWEEFRPNLARIAAVDLDSIFDRLLVHPNTFLCAFLHKEKSLMLDGDLEGMKTEIKRRERELKQSRAKTLHAGEFEPDAWFGGRELDYRFGNAMRIVKDIFESEGKDVKSQS